MQLNDLLTSLSLGVLRNLVVGGSGSGQVPPQHISLVVNAINQGLDAIHTRFIILENEVVVRAYDGLTLYPLKAIYADSNPALVPQKYIADTSEKPFLEDVIRISAIYNELGESLLFNSTDPECSLFTPSQTSLQITKPVTGDSYFVIYQARHKKLGTQLDQEIELPIGMHEALEAFVGYKIYSSMNGQEHAAKSAEHFGRYEALCNEAVFNDTLNTSLIGSENKLDQRGFR